MFDDEELPENVAAVFAAALSSAADERPCLEVFTPGHWSRLGDVELVLSPAGERRSCTVGGAATQPVAPWDRGRDVHRDEQSDVDRHDLDHDVDRDHGARPDSDIELGYDSVLAHEGREPTAALPAAVDMWSAVRAAAAKAADDLGSLYRASAFQADRATDAALLDTARAAEAAIARAQAVRARALSAFASRRPNSLDRSDEEVGAAARASRALRPETLRAVSEFCVDEVAVGLSMNPHATTTLMVESIRLVDRLPATLAALEAGTITWGHVVIAGELIAPLPRGLRARAEEQLVPKAVGRSPQSWRPIVRRLVMKLDAGAIAARVAEAVRHRTVVVHPAADGMATLSATLAAPVARAVEDVLRQHATATRTPGDERSQGERMADCLVDLLLDPGGHGLSAVQAQLTVVASVRTLLGGGADGDEPGEISGDVVPAAMVRELAAALGLLPAEATTRSTADAPTRSECSGRHSDTGADDPPGEADLGAERVADADADRPRLSSPGATGSGTPDHDAGRRAALAALLATRTTAGTGLAARPTIALVDDRTGELVAVTDATGLRRAARDGTGLGPPPDVPGYEPSAALAAFVRLRDRRCQFPGCRARPAVCDLDHQHPWLAGGRTAHDNLACLCRHHHRLSHQAPGWQLRRTTHGAGLHWTTPTGQTVVTRPPTTGRDDDLRATAGQRQVDRRGEAEEPPPF